MKTSIDTYRRVRELLRNLKNKELELMNKLDSKRVKVNGEFYNSPDEVIEAYGGGIITKSQRDRALHRFSRSVEAIAHENNAQLLFELVMLLSEKIIKMDQENKDEF